MASIKLMFLPYILPVAAVGVVAGGAIVYYKNYFGLRDKITKYIAGKIVEKVRQNPLSLFKSPFGGVIKGLLGR